MTTRDAALAVTVLVFVVVAMLSLHEKHYRDRRHLIGEARYEGLEKRLAVVESILAETRST